MFLELKTRGCKIVEEYDMTKMSEGDIKKKILETLKRHDYTYFFWDHPGDLYIFLKDPRYRDEEDVVGFMRDEFGEETYEDRQESRWLWRLKRNQKGKWEYVYLMSVYANGDYPLCISGLDFQDRDGDIDTYINNPGGKYGLVEKKYHELKMKIARASAEGFGRYTPDDHTLYVRQKNRYDGETYLDHFRKIFGRESGRKNGNPYWEIDGHTISLVPCQIEGEDYYRFDGLRLEFKECPVETWRN